MTFGRDCGFLYIAVPVVRAPYVTARNMGIVYKVSKAHGTIFWDVYVADPLRSAHLIDEICCVILLSEIRK